MKNLTSLLINMHIYKMNQRIGRFKKMSSKKIKSFIYTVFLYLGNKTYISKYE